MKLVGMMPVRNEEWCLGMTARAALRWVDELVVLCHACSDRSFEMAREIVGQRGLVISVTNPKWDEMAHRQSMLDLARGRGATHVAIIDADELLTGNLVGARGASPLRQTIEASPTAGILTLPGYNLRGGIHQYHNNGVWGQRWFSTAFKDDAALSWSGDTFHSREPRRAEGSGLHAYRTIQQGAGGVMHLWGASERRLIAKHRLYRITERLRWPSKRISDIERMYSWATDGDPSNHAYGTPATWTYAPVPVEWWSPYADLMQYLDIDAVPWQEAECERLIALHGIEYFKGLRV